MRYVRFFRISGGRGGAGGRVVLEKEEEEGGISGGGRNRLFSISLWLEYLGCVGRERKECNLLKVFFASLSDSLGSLNLNRWKETVT